MDPIVDSQGGCIRSVAISAQAQSDRSRRADSAHHAICLGMSTVAEVVAEIGALGPALQGAIEAVVAQSVEKLRSKLVELES